MRRFFRLFFCFAVLPACLLILTIVSCNHWVSSTAKGKLFESTERVPSKRVALLLGCAETLANGRTNLFFRYRIEAAASLFHQKKCEYIIVSGDNSRKDYDEPSQMTQALVKKGVPEDRIFQDYAGFRTLDSVVRAKEIFGQNDLVVISQPFHNERAVFIAEQNGIDAVAYNARAVSFPYAAKTHVREKLARVKTVLDVTILQTGPRFLGPPVSIPAEQKTTL